MLSVYLCYPDPHAAEVGQMACAVGPRVAGVGGVKKKTLSSFEAPECVRHDDVLMMRCSAVMYQSLCHSVIFIILLFPPATIVYLAAV